MNKISVVAVLIAFAFQFICFFNVNSSHFGAGHGPCTDYIDYDVNCPVGTIVDGGCEDNLFDAWSTVEECNANFDSLNAIAAHSRPGDCDQYMEENTELACPLGTQGHYRNTKSGCGPIPCLMPL